MKQLFENVKSERPILSKEEERLVAGLAERILGQLSIVENNGIYDPLLLNERPVLKFCAILEVERALRRDGKILDYWVDEITQIPTLNFKVR